MREEEIGAEEGRGIRGEEDSTSWHLRQKREGHSLAEVWRAYCVSKRDWQRCGMGDMWGASCGEKRHTEFTTGGRECGAKVGEEEESYR